MAKNQQIQMPGVFGGLMRYDSESPSRFMVSPKVVVGGVIAIILFVFILKLIFPISQISSTGGLVGGLIISLMKGVLGF
jgi:preprotein translocase subunit Sec61beta